ncbi:GNAT family N-acetyltransferase [Pseudomonas alliivorans]|nr:GNAT family N-acetyltransferase [Pseudomonas alliivorans]MEE4834205.1 GNAT family N-acetyltransferase [Pseudomonas alliivorans]MEE4924741.1 GNAT family N-acetyltransferase [Pseudomonas alliivorans]
MPPPSSQRALSNSPIARRYVWGTSGNRRVGRRRLNAAGHATSRRLAGLLDRCSLPQHYMREAALGLLDYGFAVMNLNRIAGQCFSDNLASARVLQACGLAYEGQMKEVFLKNGVFRDMLLFGLLRSQYESLEARHD